MTLHPRATAETMAIRMAEAYAETNGWDVRTDQGKLVVGMIVAGIVVGAELDTFTANELIRGYGETFPEAGVRIRQWATQIDEAAG